jgi:hypothetical protein
VRWILAIIVAVAVIAGIVIAVDRAGPAGSTSEAGAEAEISRMADIAISEDQAPHVAPLPPGSAPAPALERAIEGDVRHLIADNQMVGPLQGVTCAASGAGGGGRAPYRCAVRSAGIAYTFLAVVDERRGQLTWCKVDPPPSREEAAPEIPVSASCRA